MANQTELHRRHLLDQVVKERRAIGARSIMLFAQMYLSAHFKLPSSPMHDDICTLLEKATITRGARLAIAAPRNHAKSTVVSLAYVLWCVCYDKEPYILLISETLDQAEGALSHIKQELQFNPRLIQDFPHIAEPPTGSIKQAGRSWRKNMIITRNDVKIAALGSDTKIRGRRHREDRPSLIILDDVESEAEVRSPDQRKFKREWFDKAIMKAGSNQTNFLVIGTILHFDSLLATLVDTRKSPGWTGRTYRAIVRWSSETAMWARWEAIFSNLENYKGKRGPIAAEQFLAKHGEQMLADTEVLWPQQEDYKTLLSIRIAEGRASFDSEKQNNPVNPDDCVFQESDFHFWDADGTTLEDLIDRCAGHYTIVGACDPSMGKQKRTSDYTAIISLLRDTRKGTLYVIDSDIRRRRPNEIIDVIIKYHRSRKYSGFAMEINQYQEFLCTELRRVSQQAGAYIPIRAIRNCTDKLGRIEGLQPLITSGTIRFSKRHITLLEQLRQFPMAAHDDGPDALEMAISIGNRASSCENGIVCIPNPIGTIYDWEPGPTAQLAFRSMGL